MLEISHVLCLQSDKDKFSSGKDSTVQINLKNVLVAKIGERVKKNGEHEFSVMYTDATKAAGKGASSTVTLTVSYTACCFVQLTCLNAVPCG